MKITTDTACDEVHHHDRFIKSLNSKTEFSGLVAMHDVISKSNGGRWITGAMRQLSHAPCKEPEKSIPITLLFSKATRHVLCVEAGKDFVDTLMGFLTLPIGCIVKLLEEASMIHRPECKLAPMPSPLLTFPPDLPYTPKPKKDKVPYNEHFAISSISNVFDSVVRLDDKAMIADKNCLVDPKPAILFGAGKLLDLHNTPSTSVDQSTQDSTPRVSYYGCGNSCAFIASNPVTKCPKHKKKMNCLFKMIEDVSGGDRSEDNSAMERSDAIESVRREPRGRQCASDGCVSKFEPPPRSRRSTRAKTLISAVDTEICSPPRGSNRGSNFDAQLALPPAPAPINVKGEGYVRGGTQYMITNTLQIYASSEAIKALITLNIIRAERVGDLDTMPVSVVTAEILQLLKLSFTSTNVLNEVFAKYCADVKASGGTLQKSFF